MVDMASQEMLGAAVAKVAELEELAYTSGDWICDACGCVIQKRLMNAVDGSVGVDTRYMEEPCPNDGTAMRRLTERERADRLGEMLRPLSGAVPLGTKVRIAVGLLRQFYDLPEHQSEVIRLKEARYLDHEPDVAVLYFEAIEAAG